ncbi:hypothetical protein WMY93_020639 [Mugilogobius chulae]|uniref:RNA/RNP complex-1-interacting phosphatase n=1 Tax=Mugilogobius chulae TaxID=88201 RepID=A0AAW0NJK9_9GOBI
MSRANRKNGIPDRWLDYQAVGKRLQGSRFIAFKVPLKFALTRKLDNPADGFGPWELLDAMKRDNQELGLIIDLTFTTRYYRPEDVPESLQCVKIFTAGHEIPKDETILSFKRAVHCFLQENADNDKLIGVHCTHGLNRTGYLICRYLIDVDGVDPRKAIELFNSSRGYDIERQNYLEDLLSGPKRSNEGIEQCEQEPVKGSSKHRPVESEVNSSYMDERPPADHEPSRHRGNNRYTRHRPSLGVPSSLAPGLSFGGVGGPGLLPPPGGTGLLPTPSFPQLSAVTAGVHLRLIISGLELRVGPLHLPLGGGPALLMTKEAEDTIHPHLIMVQMPLDSGAMTRTLTLMGHMESGRALK